MIRTRVALTALIASAALLLGGCMPIAMGKSIDIIYRVDFSQSQAVMDFDDSEYTIIEADEALADFQQLLRDHDIEPWDYTPRETEGCTGGITTRVHLLYHGAGEDDMLIDGCAAEEGTFEAEATELFSSAREAAAG